MRPSRIVFATLLLAATLRFFMLYPRLPPIVASHFGPDGRANGWMTKEGFALFSLIPLGVALIVALFAPLLAARLPARLINLPNKEYWLAPERKAATVEVLYEHMEWLGCALLALFIFIYELVFAANMRGTGLANGPFTAGLVGFLVFVAMWLIRFNRRFALPASER
jgi:uncharacterized membrane protein